VTLSERQCRQDAAVKDCCH